MTDNFVDIDIKLIGLTKEYHSKFKEILPPVKVLILYRSEHEFKRHLLKKMKRHGRKGKVSE